MKLHTKATWSQLGSAQFNSLGMKSKHQSARFTHSNIERNTESNITKSNLSSRHATLFYSLVRMQCVKDEAKPRTLLTKMHTFNPNVDSKLLRQHLFLEGCTLTAGRHAIE